MAGARLRKRGSGTSRRSGRAYGAVVSSPRRPVRLGQGRGSRMTAHTYESLPASAVRIGVSVKTLRRRIAEGALPAHRCGRILTLDPHDVDALFHRART